MKTKREKLLEIALLKEKVERLTGKKVVFKEDSDNKVNKNIDLKNPDILKLINLLKDSPFIIDNTWLGKSSSSENGQQTKGYYLKVLSYNGKRFHTWDDSKIKEIRDIISKVNKDTQEVNFEFMGVADSEEEPDKEMYYNPRFSFTTKIKQK
jgi:hypothetical protein